MTEERARVTRDEVSLIMASAVALRSTCVRRSAGAVALDKQGRIVGLGYNGVPKGWPHCTTEEECPGADDPKGDTSRCLAIHAEQNLILNSADVDKIVYVYVTASPCRTCALSLSNLVNLETVIYREVYADHEGLGILREANIRFVHHPNPLPVDLLDGLRAPAP